MNNPVFISISAAAVMFIVIGGLSLLAHCYTLNGIKRRIVGDGQHGSEIIINNWQDTIFGGFAPNSQTAGVLSKALGGQ